MKDKKCSPPDFPINNSNLLKSRRSGSPPDFPINNSNLLKSRRSQLTIFIIIALVIIAVLLFLFYPRIKLIISGSAPVDYIKQCVEDSTKEALNKLTMQGGTLVPENYLLYEGNKIEYVCYTNKYYENCIMQKPFLKQDIEQEINEYIEPIVKQCFLSMKGQLESRGSYIAIEDIKVYASIIPNSVVIAVNAPTIVEKESAYSFNKFMVDIDSQMYDLIMLSSSISNYEARYGDSETLAYMMYYPDIKVEKIEREGGSRIYTLTYKPSEEKFMFASRSIPWPPGYFGGEK